MLVVMDPRATREQVRAVRDQVESAGGRAVEATAGRVVVTALGDVSPELLKTLSGVAEVREIASQYKLVTRDARPEPSVIEFASGATIGGADLAMIAGPCAIESAEQAFEVAEAVRAAGAQFFRGGAFKPRTSPYSFQGLGKQGLQILAEVRERFGLMIVTEAIDHETFDAVEAVADLIQIGSRNMHNYSLLKRAGHATKPVLLKRGMSATLHELMLSAEYVMSEGNERVVLCERGVRTFSDHTRNTLDLSLVPAVKAISHLPIIVDPSHGTGARELVSPMSRAGVAAGADGLIVEVHAHPECALSDPEQALVPQEYERLVREVRQVAAAVGRTLASPRTCAAAGDD